MVQPRPSRPWHSAWRWLLAFARALGGNNALHFIATRSAPLTLAESHTAARLLRSARVAEAAEYPEPAPGQAGQTTNDHPLAEVGTPTRAGSSAAPEPENADRRHLLDVAGLIYQRLAQYDTKAANTLVETAPDRAALIDLLHGLGLRLIQQGQDVLTFAQTGGGPELERVLVCAETGEDAPAPEPIQETLGNRPISYVDPRDTKGVFRRETGGYRRAAYPADDSLASLGIHAGDEVVAWCHFVPVDFPAGTVMLVEVPSRRSPHWRERADGRLEWGGGHPYQDDPARFLGVLGYDEQGPFLHYAGPEPWGTRRMPPPPFRIVGEVISVSHKPHGGESVCWNRWGEHVDPEHRRTWWAWCRYAVDEDGAITERDPRSEAA